MENVILVATYSGVSARRRMLHEQRSSLGATLPQLGSEARVISRKL